MAAPGGAEVVSAFFVQKIGCHPSKNWRFDSLSAKKERGQGTFCTLELYKLDNKKQKLLCGPAKGHTAGQDKNVVFFCQAKTKGCETSRMAQKKRSAEGKCLENLYRAADTLSAMLALEVKELSARQKTARRDGTETSGIVKAMKEITAILKDVAAVTKTVNEQGAEAEGGECGVVLLPKVEDV